jgi:hypothetical protein
MPEIGGPDFVPQTYWNIKVIKLRRFHGKGFKVKKVRLKGQDPVSGEGEKSLPSSPVRTSPFQASPLFRTPPLRWDYGNGWNKFVPID